MDRKVISTTFLNIVMKKIIFKFQNDRTTVGIIGLFVLADIINEAIKM